jgi:hypothetical protein
VARARCPLSTVHALDGYRSIGPTVCTVPAPCAVPRDDGLLLNDSMREYPVRCAWKRTLLRSMRDTWNATTSVVKQVSERHSGLETKLINSVSPMLRSRRLLTLAL